MLETVILCSCHAVTDREIRRAVRSGARTPREVARVCGAGSSCGACHETLHAVLAQALAESPMLDSSACAAAPDSASA